MGSRNRSDRLEPAAFWLEADSLVLWDKNPRIDQPIEEVALSIWRLGFGAPIVARVENRQIIAGHTRIKAFRWCQEQVWTGSSWAKRTEADGPFRCRDAPGPGLVPVRFVDVTEAEAQALALADNRLGEKALWDDDGLAKALRELGSWGFDTTGLGWDPGEIEEILTPEAPPTSPGEVPPAKPIPGSARVLLGRCEVRMREIPDNSMDSSVSDPPYGLSSPPPVEDVLRAWMAGEVFKYDRPGFMGKEWDSFVPGPEVWREVYRCLKPGGHVVAFSGTRTVDWLILALRLAGFEIRDVGQWCHWNGFPKSVDISKMLDGADRIGASRDRSLRFTEWMRSTGLSAKKINQITSTNMGSHYLTDKEQPSVATADLFDLLRPFLPSVPEEIEELVRWRTVESENMKRREVTAPFTDEAKRWSGWGTAIKPAIEPWVLARKPIEGTLADNVLKYGVGGLNVEACCFADGDPMWPGPTGGLGSGDPRPLNGRFPANLIHCPKPGRTEREAGCGHLPRHAPPAVDHAGDGARGDAKPRAGAGRTVRSWGTDTGGHLSKGGLHNNHPTLKPIRLMAWLTRLVTPPGGSVLDPFAGSGTVGCAAVPQGFKYTGIEIDPNFCRIAEARIGHWAAVGIENLSIDDDAAEDDVDVEPVPE